MPDDLEVIINDEIMRLIIKESNVVLVGTVDGKGEPNTSPRFVLGMVEGQKLLFADAFKDRTFRNIKAGSKVSVTVLDKEDWGGFQIKGEANHVTEQKLIDQAEKGLKKYGLVSRLHSVWSLTPKAIDPLRPRKNPRFPIMPAYA